MLAAPLTAALALTACGSAAQQQNAAAKPASTLAKKRPYAKAIGGAPSTSVKQVVFIGDSITGGFGYEGDNYPILDTLVSANGCSQDPPPADKCTNNQPGAGITSADSPVKPWAAYPYQFQQLVASENSNKGTAIPVYDYAVSGATPAMWDPTVKAPAANLAANGKMQNPGPGGCAAPNTKPQAMDSLNASDPVYKDCDPNLYPGLFGTNNYPSSLHSWDLTQLPDNTMTVMTLGANPLLSRMMQLDIVGFGMHGADNACAQQDTTTFLECLKQDLSTFRQKEHLTNVLTYAAKKGPVLLQLIYHTCPGTFGNSSTALSAYTSSNATCKGPQQAKNAYAAIDLMNNAMREAVSAVKKANPNARIAAICPGDLTDANGNCGGPNTFDSHQATETQLASRTQNFPATNPWVLSTDTGIHPTASGHRFLAQGVVSGACQNFDLFCQTANNNNVTNYWTNLSDTQKCRGSYLCTFAAVKNNTSKTWTLSGLSQSDVTLGKGDPIYAKNGEWVLYPPSTVRPGETARFMVQSRHTSLTSWGAEGLATYTIDGGGKVVIDAEVGAVYNTWDLQATKGFKATILQDISQKRGSDMILNGIVS